MRPQDANAAAGTCGARPLPVVVALGALPRTELRALAEQVEGVDLWILGDHPKELSQTSPAGASYLLEAGDRGRNLGRVLLHDAAGPGPLRDPVGDLARGRKALNLQIEMRSQMYARMRTPGLKKSIVALQEKLSGLDAEPPSGKRFEYALLRVEKTVEPDPEIAQWIAAYNADLKRINLAAAGDVPPLPEGQLGYAGGAECVDCHEEAQQVWKATPHARAWQTLVDAGKTFDAECVSCHVTGWLQPGGSALGHTDRLRDVQCEVCHGPGAAHVEVGGDEDSIRRETPEAVCQKCHNAHHSPKFDYATYLPKLLGPGHERRMDSK